MNFMEKNSLGVAVEAGPAQKMQPNSEEGRCPKDGKASAGLPPASDSPSTIPASGEGVPTTSTGPAPSPAVTADDHGKANPAVRKGRRRTKAEMQELKKAIAEYYKMGIPLSCIAMKLEVRIELVYRLFVELQVEHALPDQSEDYTIIETPNEIKKLLRKQGISDTGLLKVEKNASGDGFAMTVFNS